MRCRTVAMPVWRQGWSLLRLRTTRSDSPAWRSASSVVVDARVPTHRGMEVFPGDTQRPDHQVIRPRGTRPRPQPDAGAPARTTRRGRAEGTGYASLPSRCRVSGPEAGGDVALFLAHRIGID